VSYRNSILLGIISGILLVLSLPKPDLYPLAWFALIPLLIAVVRSEDYRQAGFAGYAAGVAFFGGSCYWIAETMLIYGGLGWGSAFSVTLLFVLVYALFIAVFGAGLFLFVRKMGPLGLLLAAPLWVTIELIRANFFFGGFPWMLFGYALVPYNGVLQMATWTGVYGLSFLAVAVNSLLALEARSMIARFSTKLRIVHASGRARGHRPRLQWVSLAFGLAIILFASLLPAPREQHSGATLPVRIVQTNIPLDQPWQKPQSDVLLNELQMLSTRKDGPSGLIVWPETPAPFYLSEDPSFRERVHRIAEESHSYFLLGYVGTAGEMVSNSAGLVDPRGNLVSRYDKMHLVPFGEYVPLKRLLFFAEKLVQQVGDFAPGTDYTISSLDSHKVSTVICYESIFPGLVREFIQRGSELIVVITNDGWFGESSAPFQHLRMGVVRAVENRRYMVRNANTGISAIIDPYGRILAQTKIGERTVLDGVVEYRTDRTFYTRHGDLFGYLNAAAIVFVAAVGAFRRGGTVR